MVVVTFALDSKVGLTNTKPFIAERITLPTKTMLPVVGLVVVYCPGVSVRYNLSPGLKLVVFQPSTIPRVIIKPN